MKRSTVFYIAYLFLFMIFTAEIILHVWFPLQENTEEGVYQQKVQNLPGVKEKINIRHNRFGFRSQLMTTKNKPEKTIRIFAVGASTVYQPFQNHEDTTFGILETMLNQAVSETGYRVEVAIFGPNGADVWQGYAFVASRIFDFDPDIVTLLWGVNDLTWHGRWGMFYKGKQERIREIRQLSNSFWRRWKDALRKKSQIYRRVSYFKKQLLMKKRIKTGQVLEWHSEKLPSLRKDHQALPFREVPARSPDALIEFQDGMEAMLAGLVSRGVMPIVLGQPVLWKPEMTTQELDALWFNVGINDGYVRAGTKWLFNEMNRFNRAQEILALKYKVPYVDLDQKVPKTLDYYIDDCHYTDLGAKKVAEVIFPTLLQEVQKRIALRTNTSNTDQVSPL